jgi:hypothetical protein
MAEIVDLGEGPGTGFKTSLSAITSLKAAMKSKIAEKQMRDIHDF